MQTKAKERVLIQQKKKRETLKQKAVAAAALGMALFFCVQGARAAAPASDNASNYVNPWGPVNPQNWASGFAPWAFTPYNPFSPNPPPTYYFIDTKRSAWAINVPQDTVDPSGNSYVGYDGVWVTFNGDGQLDTHQSFTIDALFTSPGPYYPPVQNEHPTEGIAFYAQSLTVPPDFRYIGYNHQVIGVYAGPTAAGVWQIGLAIHNTLSDENPDQWVWLPWVFQATATKPQQVHIQFVQLAAGNWKLDIRSPGQTAQVLTSTQYGTTWNTSTGMGAVQIFTSQGGQTPGGPLEWKSMSVQ